MKKTAVLLINLGTPDELSAKAVRRYLREFLHDPRVIDLPIYLRWPLVNLFIVPFRYKKTTEAYSKIWETEGSPLLKHTKNIAEHLAEEIGDKYQVEFAMRYGKPSIKDTLKRFKHCKKLIVVPLFPQYSSAANGSAIEKLFLELKQSWNVPDIKIIHEFYHHPDFIKAYAENISNALREKCIDLVLFSYHGLPERHINKSDCVSACDRENECPAIELKNHYCYRAQCYATTELIAKELNLPKHKYAVSFQSRLGRTPWIKPYTDILLADLAKKGHRNIAIVCPSFIADCLETLEEVNIRARDLWQELGGNEFTFIPCVNNSRAFIQSLTTLL